jgi:hypothetical protein
MSLNEKLAKELNVDQAVRFVGEVPGPDLPRYYNTCDIFILANRTLPNGEFEGFGIVFLEASACRKPVIAGKSGGTADPVPHGWNGLRVDGSQPVEIAQTILGRSRRGPRPASCHGQPWERTRRGPVPGDGTDSRSQPTRRWSQSPRFQGAGGCLSSQTAKP